MIKVEDRERFDTEVERLLDKSDLVIAQEFMPTEFDWRVGILDHKPLYVCKYFMMGRHWQIIKQTRPGAFSKDAGDDAGGDRAQDS